MDLQLAGKTAIVMGASRGIGLATVQALINEGVQVVGAARQVTAELAVSGATGVAVDFTGPASAQRLIDTAVEAHGGIDLLVNNLGGSDDLTLSGFLDLTDEQWSRALDVNLLATVRVTRAALPHLIQSGGVVVNVSSLGAWQPDQPPLSYNVAKAALKALGRGLATDFGPQGVRALTVTPGPTRTAMWDQYANLVGAPVEHILAAIPERFLFLLLGFLCRELARDCAHERPLSLSRRRYVCRPTARPA